MAAAGAVSLAWLAYRQLAAPRIVRTLDLASLDRHVANWLPKLPYVPYIRLGTPGADWLELRGNEGEVRISLVQRPGSRNGECTRLFRETCEELGLPGAPDGNSSRPACAVPAEPATVARVLAALLRRVFALADDARVTATIPGGE